MATSGFPNSSSGNGGKSLRFERGADARNRYTVSFIELTRNRAGLECVQENDAETTLAEVELIRIRGHLTLWGGGIHHAEIKTAVRAGVPAPDG